MPVSATEESRYWDEQATAARRTQLATVQASAAKWAALLTALLGAFGAVAFAGGLKQISDLDATAAFWAKGLTSLAAVMAVLAIILLALAAGAVGRFRRGTLTGPFLQREQSRLIGTALRQLLVGRFCALGAAALVLAGSAVVLWVPSANSPQDYLVIFSNTSAVCGTMTDAKSGATIDGHSLEGAQQVTAVSACK
jgi:hypothetical protein